MLPRERIEKLLDPGTPFLELSSLAANRAYGGEVAGGQHHRRHRHRLGPRGDHPRRRSDHQGRRLVSAVGEEDRPRARHRDREPAAGGPSLRQRRRLPAAAVGSCSRTGRWPAASSATSRMLSKMGVKQLALVFGHCTAGGAYIPALSDYNVIVRGTGAVFLGGPPLVQGGDRRGGQRRGARRRRHAHQRLAASATIPPTTRTRRSRSAAKSSRNGTAPTKMGDASASAAEAPAYDPSELYGILPDDIKKAVRHARGHRAHRRRQPLPRIPAGLRHDAGLRLRQYLGLQGRHPRQQRRAVQR